MWLSGQQKRPAEEGEGQVGVITMSGGETAALLDCERRGLQVYAPAGYRWTPKVGQRVMVIQGRGEIPCGVGARQDGDVPDRVGVEAKALELNGEQVSVQGETVDITAQRDAVVQGENVELKGEVYVYGMTLREYIISIIASIMGGG